jgi:hypothetical protein
MYELSLNKTSFFIFKGEIMMGLNPQTVISAAGTSPGVVTDFEKEIRNQTYKINVQLNKPSGGKEMLADILGQARSKPKNDQIIFLEEQFSSIDRYVIDAEIVLDQNKRGVKKLGAENEINIERRVAQCEAVKVGILNQLERLNSEKMKEIDHIFSNHSIVGTSLANPVVSTSTSGSASASVSGANTSEPIVVAGAGQKFKKKPEVADGNCGVMAVYEATRVAEEGTFNSNVNTEMRQELDEFRQKLSVYHSEDGGNATVKCRQMGEVFNNNFDRFRALALLEIVSQLKNPTNDEATTKNLQRQKVILEEATGFNDLVTTAFDHLERGGANNQYDGQQAERDVRQILSKVDLSFDGLLVGRAGKSDWLGTQDIQALMLNRGYQLESTLLPSNQGNTSTHTVMKFRDILNPEKFVYIAHKGKHWVCVEPIVDSPIAN